MASPCIMRQGSQPPPPNKPLTALPSSRRRPRSPSTRGGSIRGPAPPEQGESDTGHGPGRPGPCRWADGSACGRPAATGIYISQCPRCTSGPRFCHHGYPSSYPVGKPPAGPPPAAPLAGNARQSMRPPIPPTRQTLCGRPRGPSAGRAVRWPARAGRPFQVEGRCHPGSGPCLGLSTPGTGPGGGETASRPGGRQPDHDGRRDVGDLPPPPPGCRAGTARRQWKPSGVAYEWP
jgi:hypothetical protein